MFQLRLMFEHEINGMDADKDEPVSLDHKFFDEDFLAEKPKRPVLRPSHTVDITKSPGLTPSTKQQPNPKHSMPTSSRSKKINSPCV